MSSMNHNPNGPFIMPIVDKYKDMGTVVMGKVESGTVKKGDNLCLLPNRVSIVNFIPKSNLNAPIVCLKSTKGLYVILPSYGIFSQPSVKSIT